MNDIINNIDYSATTTTLYKNHIQFKGNISPSELDKLILTPKKRPSRTAIKLVAEIISWYLPKRNGRKKFYGDAWSTNYKYLSEKLTTSTETIRRNLAFLERGGWIYREIKHHRIQKKVRPNVLFIHLTTKTTNLISSISSNSVINNSPPQKCGDINNTNNDKNINSYSEATFLKNDFENIKSQKSITTNTKNKKNNYYEKIILNYELKLNKSDYDYLRINSMRYFCDNAINELLKELIRKSELGIIKAKTFPNKIVFLKFFAELLKKEMRSEERTNLITFKISVRKNKAEQEAEKYLKELETREDNLIDTKFKKAIASNFINLRAVEILKKLGSVKSKDAQATVEFIESIALTESEQRTIQNLARRCYITDNIPKGASIGELIGQAIERNQLTELGLTEENTTQDITISIPLPEVDNFTNITDEKWQAVEKKLTLVYGEEIGKSWFAPTKIYGQFDEDKKQLVITAKTNFIRDWVDGKYGTAIEKVVLSLFGNYEICYTKSQ